MTFKLKSYRQLHQLWVRRFPWIPWNLSFRYVLFHEGTHFLIWAGSAFYQIWLGREYCCVMRDMSRNGLFICCLWVNPSPIKNHWALGWHFWLGISSKWLHQSRRTVVACGEGLVAWWCFRKKIFKSDVSPATGWEDVMMVFSTVESVNISLAAKCCQVWREHYYFSRGLNGFL